MGESNILNKLPISASNLYAKNIYNFVENLFDKENKKTNINFEDEIIEKTMIKRVNGVVTSNIAGRNVKAVRMTSSRTVDETGIWLISSATSSATSAAAAGTSTTTRTKPCRQPGRQPGRQPSRQPGLEPSILASPTAVAAAILLAGVLAVVIGHGSGGERQRSQFRIAHAEGIARQLAKHSHQSVVAFIVHVAAAAAAAQE